MSVILFQKSLFFIFSSHEPPKLPPSQAQDTHHGQHFKVAPPPANSTITLGSPVVSHNFLFLVTLLIFYSICFSVLLVIYISLYPSINPSNFLTHLLVFSVADLKFFSAFLQFHYDVSRHEFHLIILLGIC